MLGYRLLLQFNQPTRRKIQRLIRFVRKRSPFIIASLTFLVSVVSIQGVQSKTYSETQRGSTEITVSNLLKESAPSTQLQPWLVAQQQPRTALVIGNSSYKEGGLSNPRNDAEAVAKALQELGFEVILELDLDLVGMQDAVRKFSQKLSKGGIGLFYYAGHGVQFAGDNYLVPLGALLDYPKQAQKNAYGLHNVLISMEESETSVNILILDACRNNPWYRQWRSLNRSPASVEGLNRTTPAQGTIISYATAPGKFAPDGLGRRHSPYTENLLEHLKSPGLHVRDMFVKIREEVYAETQGKQFPWIEEALIGSIVLKPGEVEEFPPSTPSTPPNSTPTSPPSSQPTPTTAAVTQPSPPSSTLRNQPGTTLISKATGVDYNPLRDLLAEEKWKEADQETTRRMLQASGRLDEEWLRTEDINNFSCEDLRIIDQLWLEFSNGKFGFSVQKDIYQSLGGTRSDNWNNTWQIFDNFGDQVGWRKEGKWLNLERDLGDGELTWELDAPSGNLPREPHRILHGGLPWTIKFEFSGSLLSHKCL